MRRRGEGLDFVPQTLMKEIEEHLEQYDDVRTNKPPQCATVS